MAERRIFSLIVWTSISLHLVYCHPNGVGTSNTFSSSESEDTHIFHEEIFPLIFLDENNEPFIHSSSARARSGLLRRYTNEDHFPLLLDYQPMALLSLPVVDGLHTPLDDAMASPILFQDNAFQFHNAYAYDSPDEFGIFTREGVDDESEDEESDADDPGHSHTHAQGHSSGSSSEHGHGHGDDHGHGDGHGYNHGHHPGDGYCDGQGWCFNTDKKVSKEHVKEIIKQYPHIRKQVIHHVLGVVEEYGPEVANEALAYFNKGTGEVLGTFHAISDIISSEDHGPGHGHKGHGGHGGHGHGGHGHKGHGGHGGHGSHDDYGDHGHGDHGGHGYNKKGHGKGYSKKGYGGHGHGHGHGGHYPYGYGGYNKNFGQVKGEPDLWSRRQDWDYRTHGQYQVVDLGHHPLDKYHNTWSSHGKGHSHHW